MEVTWRDFLIRLIDAFGSTFLFIIINFIFLAWCQREEDGSYHGKFVGSFNTYHHQVEGDIYAVDEYTLLIKNFIYDGNGRGG